MNGSGRQLKHPGVRHRLLATVSAAALFGFVAVSDARAADSEKPSIWIDFSGQFEQLSDSQEKWIPDFISGPHPGPLAGTELNIQNPPQRGYDGEAGLSYQPGGGDWVLSLSAHIGRAVKKKDVDISHYISRFGISHYLGKTHNSETHKIVDFKAGMDVGLGALGSSSVISVGVRYANMQSRSNVNIMTNFIIGTPSQGGATNNPDSRILRKFRGVGPSLSWEASLPLAGTQDSGQLGLDWGASAALLFGRQTATQTIDGYYIYFNRGIGQVPHHVHSQSARQKSVTVPDLGGYLAASYRFPNAKFSIGYRADMFFGAIDGGIAVAKKENRGFYGPFASISIGISPSDF